MLLFYHKIHRNSTAHPILHAPIEIGNPLQNPLGGIRQNKDAEAPCKHGCGFSERDLAEQQTAAGDEENQRRQLIGDELRNAQRKDAEPFHQRQQGDQGQTSLSLPYLSRRSLDIL